MCVRYVGKAQGSEQSGENCFGEFLMDRSANPMRCTNNRLACSHRMAACAQYRQAFPSIQVSKQVMQRNCVMKDRLEESMLSIRLSGLLEILGRDKVTSFLSDHETGQNSQTAVRRRRCASDGAIGDNGSTL